MACGCQGGNRSATSWLYTNPNGEQFTFKSQLEARAKQIRDGGKGTVTAIR